MDTLTFLLPPLAASLILAGIHAYLGLHVVERGVIFVDLSLAQIAAFGSAVAILVPAIGGDPHSTGAYWMSLAFTHGRRGGLFDGARAARAHSAGSDHRHLLRGGLGGDRRRDEQGDVGDRAPQGHAGRQHPGGVVGRGRQDGGALRRHRPLPLRLPQALPGASRSTTVPTRRRVHALVGFPLLRVVRLRGHVVGVDRRRAARLLVSDRARRWARCSTPTRSDDAWPWAGPWGRWSRRSASTSRCCSICRPARPSSARSARCSRSWRCSGRCCVPRAAS